MHIITDTQGRIIRSSAPLEEGLNVFGRVHGVVQDSFILSPVPAGGIGNDADPVTLDAAAIFIFVKKGYVVWVSSDICALRDLFFAKKNAQEWVIGDSFFELAKHFSVLTTRAEIISFFLRKGFFLPGQTFFREISRVPVGMRLHFTKEGPREERVWGNIKEGKRTYETFKRAIASVLEVRNLNDDSALLLSGGCDSGLLVALAALQRRVRPPTFTSVYKQTLKTNEWDAHWSKTVADHLGLEHVLLEMDFDRYSLEESLSSLVERMPLTAHLSVGFLSLYKEVARRKKKTVWSGQNADSVYMLGPSGKGKGGILKRWYLTKEYWQSLSGISDRNPFGFFMRAVGSLGPLALYMRRGVWFRQPETFGELLHAFEQAEEALALPRSQTPRGNSLNTMTSLEAKQMFFERKIQTFLIGGDPRVHQAVAENFSCDSVLPYSAANMMHFFRGLPLTLHDVFHPKRFIYQYLEELLGKKAYLRLYGSRRILATAKRYLTWKEWQASILQNTRFGEGLRESLKLARTHGIRKREEHGFDEQNLQHMIGSAWFSEVMKRIEGAGVQIEIS